MRTLKTFLVVAALFLLSFCSGCVGTLPGGRQDNSQDIAGLPLDAVVALVDEDSGIYCSGSVIHTPRGREILTAAHCVSGEAFVLVAPHDAYDDYDHVGYSFPAAVLEVDDDIDLARLSVPQGLNLERVRAVHLGDQPNYLDPVVAVGHASGWGWVAHPGHASSIQPGQDWYFVSCGIIPGMSGGPVFNSDWEVVGVNQFVVLGRLGAYTELGGVARADVIYDFVQ